MAKEITYRYNADTDSYERIYHSLGRRIASLGGYLLIGILLGAAFFVAVFFLFDSPTQENLRSENAKLRNQLRILNKRLDGSLKVMEGIRDRDDNYYRVLLQMDPLSDSQRLSGFDSGDRYRNLRSLSDGDLLVELHRGLDLLDRELYSQSQSFDDLKDAAMHRRDQLRHTPAVLPVDIRKYSLASGYGHRTDPLYGTVDFHSGVDLAGKVGDPVVATADGTVAEAGWITGRGYTVVIDHGYNYRTMYAHLSRVETTVGARVRRGQKIGAMGSTGKSTSPHLHYEVIFKGEPQNPVNYYYMDMTPEEYDEMLRRASNAGNVLD